jgi:hypothetical protein
MCKMRRDDLTMEALILSISCRDQIFSPREIATATERLAVVMIVRSRSSDFVTRIIRIISGFLAVHAGLHSLPTSGH